MHILILGLGGTGAFVAAALLPEKEHRFTLMDADKFEAKNMDRQFVAVFDRYIRGADGADDDINPYTKADVCAEYLSSDPESTKALSTWWTKSTTLQDVDYPDIIICCVDNNATRRQVIDTVLRACPDALGTVPVIFPGNGPTFGQCVTFWPHLAGTNADPREFLEGWLAVDDEHPADANDPAGRCTSGKTLDEQPQTASANLAAAGLAICHVQSAIEAIAKQREFGSLHLNHRIFRSSFTWDDINSTAKPEKP